MIEGLELRTSWTRSWFKWRLTPLSYLAPQNYFQKLIFCMLNRNREWNCNIGNLWNSCRDIQIFPTISFPHVFYSTSTFLYLCLCSHLSIFNLDLCLFIDSYLLEHFWTEHYSSLNQLLISIHPPPSTCSEI